MSDLRNEGACADCTAARSLKAISMRSIPIAEYRYPSGMHLPVMTIRIDLRDVAGRLGVTVETWEEDGLGPACGMFLRLPSGRVVLLRELEHAVKRLGAEGPEVFADVGDLAALDVERLVAEVLDDLDLPREQVAWIASNDARQRAADLFARIVRMHEGGAQR